MRLDITGLLSENQLTLLKTYAAVNVFGSHVREQKNGKTVWVEKSTPRPTEAAVRTWLAEDVLNVVDPIAKAVEISDFDNTDELLAWLQGEEN